MNDRDLANKKDEYLRKYCRKEYLDIYALRKEVKDAEEDVVLKESIYETQLLLDRVLGNKGSDAYKVPKEVYDKVKYLKQKLQEAEDTLKEKKKEGRRSDGYRRVGLIEKPSLPDDMSKAWYKNTLDGFSEETLESCKKVLEYVSGKGYTNDLYILIHAEKMWGLVKNGSMVGLVEGDDKLIKSFITAVNRDLKSKPEIIVFPSRGRECFFMDYIACYSTYSEFARVFKGKIGVSLNSWLNL